MATVPAAAIRFVLTDINTVLGQQERQRLLHVSAPGMLEGACNPTQIQTDPASMSFCMLPIQEGAGHAVLSAYVEIVFDNADNRIPVRLAARAWLCEVLQMR